MLNSYSKNILLIVLTIVLSAGAIFGQTNGFTYQGRLTDGGTPANGNYDLQFALFDAADGNNQIGQTKTVSGVPVSAGVFTVTLDFGANAFSGANRFLEISARPAGAAAFTLLTPRQSITSTPYAVRSLNAATADTATNAQQLGNLPVSTYVLTVDPRLSDSRPPTGGSSNYIQNGNGPQAGNFNISGNGTAGGALSGNTVNAATQYNLGGQKILSLSSDNGLSLGSTGNVGIGITSNSKLAVAGTVESTSGGFKFPDASVQTSAAAKTYFTVGLADLELDHSGFFTNISTLNLPPGVYLLTATVQFQNKANDLFADNTRQVRCYFNDEFLGTFRLGAPGNSMDFFITTMHTVLTQPASGPVSFKCGDQFNDSGHVFAKARRFSAVRVGDLQPQ
jgi:hypothetical protein